MDASEAVEALAMVGLSGSQVSEITGGWAFWTFDLDDRWIARFPRNAEIAAAARRELRLLPEISRRLSFRVPEPSRDGVWSGWPFFAYPKIAGSGLTLADRSEAVLLRIGAMLNELHDVPVELAVDLLGVEDAANAWRIRYEMLWPDVERLALPEMDTETATRVQLEFNRFMAQPFSHPMTLIHNDLGLEHLLVDECSGVPVGIIDFESAWIGDPAIDFVPLVAAFGAEALEQLLVGRDLGDRLGERMWFYRWMGSIHNIMYGVTEQVEHERDAGLAQLLVRLDHRW